MRTFPSCGMIPVVFTVAFSNCLYLLFALYGEIEDINPDEKISLKVFPWLSVLYRRTKNLQHLLGVLIKGITQSKDSAELVFFSPLSCL